MNITMLFPRPKDAAERRLEQELAGYDTPADIADLMAAVDRQDGADAEMIRGILSRNLQEWNRRPTPIH